MELLFFKSKRKNIVTRWQLDFSHYVVFLLHHPLPLPHTLLPYMLRTPQMSGCFIFIG